MSGNQFTVGWVPESKTLGVRRCLCTYRVVQKNGTNLMTP